MPMLTKLFVISMDASNVFGCSSNVTILLNEGCFLVFKTLISFWASEKKATSPPATKKERINKITAINMNMPVMAGTIARKLRGSNQAAVTE